MRGAFGFGCRSEATRWMHGVGMERKKETRRPSTPGIPKPPIRNAERRTDECSTSHLRFCFSRTVRQEYLPLQSCRAADPLRASCEDALPAVHLNANRTAKASSGSKQDGMVNKVRGPSTPAHEHFAHHGNVGSRRSIHRHRCRISPLPLRLVPSGCSWLESTRVGSKHVACG